MILIFNDFWLKRKMDNFDPYNVSLAIATNISQRLKTGFVLQGHNIVLKYKHLLTLLKKNSLCWLGMF